MLDRMSRRPEPAAVEKTISALAAAMGNRLVTSQGVRQEHTNTKSWVDVSIPDAVVYAID